MRTKSTTLLISSMVAVLQPLTGFGQNADNGLEEVVVTAQKREERIIEVPIAIAVLDGQMLQDRGFTNIQDLAFAVPGLTMREDGPGSYTIFMRGLSNQYGTGALVGVYLDEAPISLTGFDQLDTRYHDMERVEVLKGPQGTLYGQGSVAGAIRYITKAPVLDRYEGTLGGSISSVSGGDERETINGAINLPLVADKFAIRIAAVAEQGGGWQDQPQAGIKDGNGQDVINARVRALWQVTDEFAINAKIIAHRNEIKLGQGYENADHTVTVGVDRAWALVPKKYDYDLYDLTMTYDFGGFQLLSATTYIDHDNQYPYTTISGPQTTSAGFESSNERHVSAMQFAQEVRLTSTGDAALEWTLGAFYRDAKRYFYRDGLSRSAAGLVTRSFFRQDDTYKSTSVFADAAYRITERFKLGAGVRYFVDDQTGSDGIYLESKSFHSTDPRVYASFKLSENVNMYGSVGKGFRSGGFNRGTTLPDYKPESLISYELGTKGSVLDRRLGFEVALFYSDYKDMLRRGLQFVPALNNLQSNTSNIGKVEVKGVEAGVTLQPASALTFYANAAYTDSEIKEVDALNSTSIAGDPVDYVPELSYAVGGRVGFDVAALPSFIRVDYNYRDAVTYIDRTSFLPQYIPQTSDAIGLLDASVGVTWNAATVELFGTNLTNENKWIDPYYNWNNANRTRPRVVGVRVNYEF
ncbi:TonB-dependent receptor [Peristeroidobacter soli]|uniref:TonB-dependent receptor n=1 Tax=Peristeroidobacter soli TaxID=2497877 RepID=UPI00101C4797|nr:TonB-dependent receptor [Peristeroidobacter soli]